jgi:hypothetical protein
LPHASTHTYTLVLIKQYTHSVHTTAAADGGRFRTLRRDTRGDKGLLTAPTTRPFIPEAPRLQKWDANRYFYNLNPAGRSLMKRPSSALRESLPWCLCPRATLFNKRVRFLRERKINLGALLLLVELRAILLDGRKFLLFPCVCAAMRV